MTTPTVPVTVTLAAQDGTPYEGVVVRARLDGNEIYEGIVISDSAEATTDADGVAVLNLFPNAPSPTGLGTQGTTYRFVAAIPGGRALNVNARVPNLACRLENILVDDDDDPVELDAAELAVLQAQAAVTTAAGSAADAEANRALTALDRIATGEDRAATAADRTAVAADKLEVEEFLSEFGDLTTAIEAAQQAAADAAGDAATTAADRVQTGLDVVAAEAAKAGAETARDAALAATKVYPDTASGLAAVASGEYFYVPSAELEESLILYRNNAGVAQEIKRYISADLFTYRDTRWAAAYVDGEGRVAFGIDNEGTTSAANLEATAGSVGTLEVGTISIGGAAFDPADVEAALAAAAPELATSYVHLFSYGQSLSVGESATPIQTTTQPYDSLMFTGGVRPQMSSTDPGVVYASLVPLIESSTHVASNPYATTTSGETPVGGMCHAVKQLLADENEITHSSSFYKLIGTATGRGATNITALSSGTTPYDRLIAEVGYAKALCDADSRTYSVGAVMWLQGEADWSDPTPYKAKLLALQASLDADIRAITGQADPVHLFTYQTPGSTPFSVALQQLAAAEESDYIHMAMPVYNLGYYSDNVHLSGVGSRRAGAYLGKVFKRVMVDRRAWRPLSPISATRVGNSIYLKLHVPFGRVVIDTTLVAAVAQYGFVVKDLSSVGVVVSSITVEGRDTIRLVVPSNPTGFTLEYATTYRGGNIRDTEGDDVVFDPGGTNYPLHNWLVAFRKTVV